MGQVPSEWVCTLGLISSAQLIDPVKDTLTQKALTSLHSPVIGGIFMGPNLDLLAFHAKPVHGHWVMMKERTLFVQMLCKEKGHSCSKVLGSWMALGRVFKGRIRRSLRIEGLANTCMLLIGWWEVGSIMPRSQHQQLSGSSWPGGYVLVVNRQSASSAWYLFVFN